MNSVEYKQGTASLLNVTAFDSSTEMTIPAEGFWERREMTVVCCVIECDALRVSPHPTHSPHLARDNPRFPTQMEMLRPGDWRKDVQTPDLLRPAAGSA